MHAISYDGENSRFPPRNFASRAKPEIIDRRHGHEEREKPRCLGMMTVVSSGGRGGLQRLGRRGKEDLGRLYEISTAEPRITFLSN